MDSSMSVVRNCTKAWGAVVQACGTHKNYSWQENTKSALSQGAEFITDSERDSGGNNSCNENEPEVCKTCYCSHDIDADDDDDDDDTLCDDGDEHLKLKGSCSFGLREATL
jgi:hypothetical protein